MNALGEIADIRTRNCYLVLECLRKKSLTRAEISRETRLSRSTISAIVTHLIDLDLIEETGAVNHGGGRPGIVLRLATERFVLVGAELGRQRTELVLTDLGGTSLGNLQSPGIDGRSAHCVLDELSGAISTLLAERPELTCLGLGLGVPSPIDPSNPGYLDASILPQWIDINIQTGLEQRLGLPVFVDNDANMGAFAEYWWTGHVESVIFVRLSAGVGAGMINSGQIHYGMRGIAGEIGHMSIDPDGPQCVCGQRGCLVKFVGAEALREAVGRIGIRSSGADAFDELAERAKNGDADAQKTQNGLVDNLATGLTSLVNVVAPETIYLSGAITALGDPFLKRLQDTLKERTLFGVGADTQVSWTNHGFLAVPKGACGYVMRALFNNVRRIGHALRESA